jgi:uncharacterized protein
MTQSTLEMTIRLADEEALVLGERALYLTTRKTLLAADLHLGKAATFRAAAIPLPGGTTTETLRRLSSAIDRTGAERLLILGDLFHARSGRAASTLAAVASWREDYAQLEMVLVRGNHDIHAGDPPENWRVTCYDGPLHEPPFVFQHEPLAAQDGYVLAGHLHPAALLNGRGRQSLKLPCFHLTEKVGTLPAFGEFTGGALIRPKRGDRVFVVVEGQVIQVNGD